MKLLRQHIEALIFTADQPVSPDEISNCLKTVYGWELSKDEISEQVDQLKEKYAHEDFGFELTEIGGGYQFLSKKDFHTAIHVMLQLKEKKRLSTAAMETLSIIAYKQPVTKPDLEQIRGVSCDYSIQKLLEKDLIVISGKSDGPGRPLLYKTSQNFMDHFGLRSVKDLPKLKDIHPEENQIGSPSDLIELLESEEDPDSVAMGSTDTDQEEMQADETVKIQPEIVDEVLEQTENQIKEEKSEGIEHHSEEVSEEVSDTHAQ
jgi:segregation and condensation protein B